MLQSNKSIPFFLWAIIPALIIIIQIVIELTVPQSISARLHSETGPHELVQFLFVVPCVPLAAWLLMKAQTPLLKFWFGAAALGCLYIAGEEISWGQHILGWTTPEFWSGVNDQNETNFHNTSDWLDQKPRLLLFIGAVVAGLIIPALRRWCPSRLPQKFTVLYPSNLLIPVTLGVLLPYAAQEIAEHFFDARLFERVSEVQELYIYYFLFLYLLDFKNRIFSK